jgi:endoglucanase
MIKIKHLKTVLLGGLTLVFLAPNIAQNLSENIRLNQIGFYPNAQKEAVWVGDVQPSFFVLTADRKDTVFRGQLSAQRTNPMSQKKSQIADFSALKKMGKYRVFIPNVGYSHVFEIQKDVHRAAAMASLKGFYYQRMSTELLEKHAGVYKRPAGHPDDKVRIHASAATAERAENSLIAAPKGWYDAGDYNKYIVNSGISTGTLLLLYENHPNFLKSFDINIPESGDTTPDLLDEALWNLHWMLAMQDPNDGGVYHKLTNPQFDGMNLMPHQATKERYVIQKTTTATLDFAAVMAQSYRVLKQFDTKMPKLADSCLAAAEKAWAWAVKNPDQLYDQNAMNKKYPPSVSTGAYDDKNATDEWTWAATELYISTKKDQYYPADKLFPAAAPQLQTWRDVHRMSYYSLIQHQHNLTDAGKKDLPKLRQYVLNFADELLRGVENQAYNTVMGKSEKDFMWGSSGHAANQGIALLQAYKLTKEKKYLQGAMSNLDYLFGKNGVGYCFLTGFGSKQVMHIHHRPSESDGIEKPVPGLLSGGTNPKKQDKCAGYTTDIADECFLDHSCSYSTNENCINWNAAMVYLAVAMEALQGDF